MADYFSNPPPGLDLNESRTASNNAIGIVLFVLSAVFVGLRLLTRLKYQQAKLGLDDWLMNLGLVSRELFAFNAILTTAGPQCWESSLLYSG